jgi:hypothetical protein
MKFELYKLVALAVDVPEYELKKGDLVTIVEFLASNGHHPNGYVVEISDVLGNTLDVATLYEHQLTALLPRAMFSMREVAVV